MKYYVTIKDEQKNEVTPRAFKFTSKKRAKAWIEEFNNTNSPLTAELEQADKPKRS